ncbi:MAG TPA: SRPBCC family protein [Actinomycetota bacterium]|nr:SRPBCC family protein [Actinomycetota bacterium]
MTELKVTAEPGVPQVLTEREFNAPRELLYRAFTDIDLLTQWLGPRQYTMKVDRFDMRDGGTYRYLHVGDDGDEHWFHGVFHGEPSLDGIVQTFEYEGVPGHVSLDTVTFEERDGKTVVHTNTVFQSIEDRDGMVQSGMAEGMNDGYDRLEELLAKQLAD